MANELAEPTDQQVLESLIAITVADFVALLYFSLNLFMFNSNTQKVAITTAKTVSTWTYAQMVHYWGGLAIYTSFFVANFLILLGVPIGGTAGLWISQNVYGYAYPAWLITIAILTILSLEELRTTLVAGTDAPSLALMELIGTEFAGLLGIMGDNALSWNFNYANWYHAATKLAGGSGDAQEEETVEEEAAADENADVAGEALFIAF